MRYGVRVRQHLLVALSAVAAVSAACQRAFPVAPSGDGAAPEGEVEQTTAPAACTTSYYDQEHRVGFDLPSSFDGPTTTQPTMGAMFAVTFSGPQEMQLMLEIIPAETGSLEEFVLAEESERVFFSGRSTFTTQNGAPGQTLAWRFAFGSTVLNRWVSECTVAAYTESSDGICRLLGRVSLSARGDYPGCSAQAATLREIVETICAD